jgi:hypothetical protein
MTDTTTITPVQADFSSVPLPEYRLYRADTSGESRWYYCPETDRYYPSVTSVIGATTPTPYGLLQWMKTHGHAADDIRDERAEYGTFLHREIGRLLKTGEYDLDALPSACLSAAIEAGESRLAASWYADARKDILAFEAFRREKEVEPIAIEAVLKSEGGYAGAIDLVCLLKFGRGQVVAIVDFKSGRKGFYESHEIQLHMYRALWQENLPDLPIGMLFNWSPKDWVSAPSYNLKNQTDSQNAAKIPHLIGQFSVGSQAPPRQLVVRGKITPDTPLDRLFGFEEIRDRIHHTNRAA